MAAQARKVEPDIEDSKWFRWHHGQLSEGREYFALEYPTPPAVDMSDVPIEQVLQRASHLSKSPLLLACHDGRGWRSWRLVVARASNDLQDRKPTRAPPESPAGDEHRWASGPQDR